MALFVLLLCLFDISVCIGAFVIGLGQISSFLSSNNVNSLEKRCQKLHRVVNELIDKELDICQSQNNKLTDGLDKAEQEQAKADTIIESMLAVFQKTTMTGRHYRIL